ncbi:MAG: HIT family protein [Defluviitaleaceae bacterium]|nr:HIT family protein [Defluviitaleaceae bacterium]
MNELTNTIFYKIIQGELPCYKIYEDEKFLVILDKFPSSLGHCLIMPKTPSRNIFDLDEVSAGELYPLAKRMAVAVKSAVDADGVHVLQNNEAEADQTVFYFHLHVVPRHKNDGVRLGKPLSGISDEQMEKVAQALRKELG